ncbi:MAG: alpha/beta hydrolase-fold protein [Pseudomonadota bacterium]
MSTAALRTLAVLSICLLSSPIVQAREALDRLFGMGPVDTFTIESETLGRDFHIYVRKPLNYDEADCKWPVVYLLDGGILFPMLSPLQFMMEIDELAPPVVMVGISYGGLGSRNGNFRATDYTAPSDEETRFGGAAAYQDFLAVELIPRIQANYRVDQANSLVLGQSLGGQFTLLTALNRPELFGFYLAINPAIHRNLDLFLNLEAAERAATTPLMITRSTQERARYRTPLQQWLTQRQQDFGEALELEIRWLAGEHHASSAPAAYQAVMSWWSPNACER